MKEKLFSEYRPHDYRIPRSMRECYGWDARLTTEEPESPVWALAVWSVCAFMLMVMLLVSVIKHPAEKKSAVGVDTRRYVTYSCITVTQDRTATKGDVHGPYLRPHPSGRAWRVARADCKFDRSG